jgi:hypothetical protein
MSYTSINDITINIINKKVLFIDLETTGLPIINKEKNTNIKQEEKYPDYRKNEFYDEARIVQFGWIYLEDFDYTYDIKPENILTRIVKPDGFIIPEESIQIHKITNEISNEKGQSIKKCIKKFKNIFNEVDYIIGYNIYFDINVLLNELNRCGIKNSIKKIKNLIINNKLLCIGELASQYKGYKSGMPKQTKIYAELIGKNLENAHNAQYDICGTIELMYWFNTNKKIFGNVIEENIAKNIKKELDKMNFNFINDNDNDINYGQKWLSDEYKLLLNEINENKTINEICINHGRNFRGIKGGMKRLIAQNINNIKIKNYYKNNFNKNIDNEVNDIIDNEVNDKIDNEVNDKKYIKENFPNIGKKWSNQEYIVLKNEINDKMSLEEICTSHGRYKGGIKKAIKKLIENGEIKYNDELKNMYSIKSYVIVHKDDIVHNNLCDDDKETYEEIIGILTNKIDNLKNKNRILKEEINILKSKITYV